MARTAKCVDCGEIRTLSYDTKQCHQCEGAEREQELDAMDELLINAENWTETRSNPRPSVTHSLMRSNVKQIFSDSIARRKGTRDWSKLPSDFERDAVRGAFEDCKAYFPKDAINARIKASKARTFAELESACAKVPEYHAEVL